MEFKTFWFSLSVPQRERFASRCQTTAKHLRNVAYKSRPAAEKLAIAIDRESDGKVSCEEVRPDVDWAHIRGTAVASGMASN